MSSRLPTSRLRRSASTSMASANSRRWSASHATSDWRRLVADALIEASGVRRSWLTAWRRAVRNWSASVRRAATAASAWRRRDWRARARLDRKVRRTRWSSAERWAPRRTSTAVPSVVRSQRSPSNGSLGGSGPELASRIQPSSRLDRSETASSENVARSWSSRPGSGFGSPIRMPLVRARAPASARACRASRLRLATRSTSTLAPAAAVTKMASAVTFSGSLIVNVWIGGTKNQLTSSDAPIAATTPTTTPPTTAMATVATRNSSRSVGEGDVVARRREERGEERETDDGKADGERLPARRTSAPGGAGGGVPCRRPGWQLVRLPASPWAITCTSKPSASPDDAVHDGTAEQLVPAAAAAGADDDLGGLLGAGEVDQGDGHGVADDLPVGAAELLQQAALLGEGRTGAGLETVRRHDVHADQAPPQAPGDARRPAHELLAAGGAGDGHDHALPGLPRIGDAVRLHVALQALLDPIGDPQQGQLPQGGEVAGPEVVRQGGVDPLGRVDVAVGHAAPKCLRAHVDELDLVGAAHDLVGHRLALLHAGDPLDDVVQALEVLDVHRGDDVDAGVEEVVDVLPALLVTAAGHVGVGELVDERHGGLAGQDGIDVHLLEGGAPVVEAAARHDFEVAELGLRPGPAVGLDETDHDIGAALVTAPALVEHGERLAHPGRGAEVHAQLPTPAGGGGAGHVTSRRGRGSARARSHQARRRWPTAAHSCGARSP